MKQKLLCSWEIPTALRCYYLIDFIGACTFPDSLSSYSLHSAGITPTRTSSSWVYPAFEAISQLISYRILRHQIRASQLSSHRDPSYPWRFKRSPASVQPPPHSQSQRTDLGSCCALPASVGWRQRIAHKQIALPASRISNSASGLGGRVHTLRHHSDLFARFCVVVVDYPIKMHAASSAAGDGSGGGGGDRHALTASSAAEVARHEAMVREFEIRRLEREVVVPANVEDVKARLRELGEPVTLFGEDHASRRDRLKRITAERTLKGAALPGSEAAALQEAGVAEEQKEVFYTEGPALLRKVRLAIAQFSLPRAAERIARLKRLRNADPEGKEEAAETARCRRKAAQMRNEFSEIADSRPLSACAFNTEGNKLATASWSGNARLWKVSLDTFQNEADGDADISGDAPKPVANVDLTTLVTFRSHMDRLTDIQWHPDSSLYGGNGAVLTAGSDGIAKLWAASDTGDADNGAEASSAGSKGSKAPKLLHEFTGHLERLARVGFHPSGKVCGTASFDKTWRLWDVETGQEVLLQEGHSRAVYAIAFQVDGALIGSAGLDCATRIWDSRTGRCIAALQGHVKPVHAASFSPHGNRIVTGAADNTIRVWDLRKRRVEHVVAGHTSLISGVAFEPDFGRVLFSSSFDGTARLWAVDGGIDSGSTCLQTLAGHDGKITGSAILGGGMLAATAGYDRTVKLWRPS